MMRKYLTLCIVIMFVINAQAQLFIDNGSGDTLSIRNATGGTLANSETTATNVAIYVDGDIIIEGIYDNVSAEVQLTGDFSNSGTFTSTGDEVFISDAVQTISGTLTGTNNFNNLILKDTLLTLNNTIEIDSAGKLVFEKGVLQTASNYVYVKDTLTTAITGAGTNGALDKFIEGELRRNIVAGTTYDFAVGGTHIDAGGGDGVQYVSLLSNNGNGIISAIFNDSTGIGVLDSIVICPAGNGDYQDVEYRIRNGSWVITNPGGGITNYDITLNPTDYTDNGYVDYTILKDGVPTGRDVCDGIASLPPITHDSLSSFSIFEVTVSTNTSLLPIELLDFYAKPIDNRFVQLDWQTASEINNDYFTIERSTNGVDWEGIIQIGGVGNSSNLLSYSVIDETPYQGLSYYRLKQTDYDGQYSYSQVKSVNIKSEGDSGIEIFPNPTESQITIIGNILELEQVKIYNTLGQDVTMFSTQISYDESKIVIDLSDLSEGMYYIQTKTTANKVYKQ